MSENFLLSILNATKFKREGMKKHPLLVIIQTIAAFELIN
jgi:hypothetical protein